MYPVDVGVNIVITINSAVDHHITDEITTASVRLIAGASDRDKGSVCLEFGTRS